MARPRTRARKTYEELLAENEEKLLKAKRDEEMQELYTYMQENELSAQDVLVSLREQNSDLEEREAS